ncbi:aspartyl protease family protein [Methylacidiphilum kamchatkense]|uniref:Tetratricopeptide repeat protein n=1 Tax=Methylacidiphilum kamchatkense Kam1 TaxID=1202785 RepID=A0A516TND0_9BACT|nr:aspartyl protease family protein [Methylacidiphilum kamchatkense]QDQ42750.1 tetratricopeptide repeat protein [Methylacidiphilum kamchatkense Kam1]
MKGKEPLKQSFFLFSFYALCLSFFSSGLLALSSEQQVAEQRLNILYRSGLFEEASRMARALLQKNPSCFSCWMIIGETALCRGNLELAREAFHRALKIQPGERRPKALLKEIYIRQDRYSLAAPLAYELGELGLGDLLKSFKDQKPFAVDSTREQAVVRFKDFVPYPIIETELSGGIKARFMIDTGSTYVILSPRLANKAQIVLFRKEKETSTMGSYWIQFGKIHSMNIGGATIRNIPAVVHSLLAIPRTGLEIDGILGENFLSHFLPTFDLRGRWKSVPKFFFLRFSKDDPLSSFKSLNLSDGKIRVIPFLIGPAQTLVVQGKINNSVPLLFLLDTGTPGYFMCSPLVAKLSKVWLQQNFFSDQSGPFIHHESGQSIDMHWGLGTSQSPLELGLANQLEIMGERIRGILQGGVGSLPMDMSWNLGFWTGGMIGFGFFYDKVSTIDYKNQKIYFFIPEQKASQHK